MDRRTVIAVVLSLAIYYTWLTLRGPPKPPPDAVPAEPVPVAAPAPAAPLPPPVPAPDTVTLSFEMCGTTGKLSTDGGRLHDLTVDGHNGPYHVVPLYSWVFGWIKHAGIVVSGWTPWPIPEDPDKRVTWPWHPYGDDPGPAVVLGEHAGGLLTGAGPLDELVPMTVVSSSAEKVELRGVSAAGVEIAKTLTQHELGDACAIDVDVTWTNRGSTPFTGETWFTARDHVAKTESRYEAQRMPVALVDDKLHYGGHAAAGCGSGCFGGGTALGDDSGPFPVLGPVSWFGLSERFFGFYVVPRPSGHEGAAGELTDLRFERIGKGDDAIDGAVLGTTAPLAPGQSRSESFQVYAGPNQARALEAVDPSLARAIDLGFWAFFGWPLLWLLRQFHALTGSWGLAIISLTVFVKTLFFPLTQFSMVSAQKMQALQPELQALKEQFADDPTELNRRTMALMTERGANPLWGCLPMLAQTPVWIALYNVMLWSVDLYHARFMYLKDLASADPTSVLPLAIMALMWGQQRLTSTAQLDPAQQQVMRFMPLIFGFMFFAAPSGLAIYTFVNMTLSIAQQWVIRRRYGGPGAGLPAAMPLG